MFKQIVKSIYFLCFSIIKYAKYPTCEIHTNFVLPGVKLGKHVLIRKHCKINKDVEIGDYTFINEYTRIDTNTKSIGKFCSISHNVKIGMGPHPLNFISTSPVLYLKHRNFVSEDLYDEYDDKGYTTIGNDVLIGANAVILAGVKVGDGAVIAAGSIVVADVPAYSIVGGNPAKIIKYRFSESVIIKLQKIEWWNLGYSVLKQKKEYYSDVNKFISNIDV